MHCPDSRSSLTPYLSGGPRKTVGWKRANTHARVALASAITLVAWNAHDCSHQICSPSPPLVEPSHSCRAYLTGAHDPATRASSAANAIFREAAMCTNLESSLSLKFTRSSARDAHFPRSIATRLMCTAALISHTVFAQTLPVTTAGSTAGSYGVSANGQATYQIPLWTPTGSHGLQPNLALTYDSQSGGSFVGMGWSLSGLSTISRCNRTFAQKECGQTVLYAPTP